MRRGVSSNLNYKGRYPFYASEIFNSEASDITNMLFTIKPPKKEEEKVVESTEDEQTGQKGTYAATSESLNEDMERREEDQKGEIEDPGSEVKESEKEQAEQATDQIAEEKVGKKVETEVKLIEEAKTAEEQPAETKPSEENEQKAAGEKPAEDKVEEEQKVEEAAEPKEVSAEEETKDLPDEAAKDVEGMNEEYGAESKPSQPDEDDNVLQEDQIQDKDSFKGRYGLLEKLLSFLSAREDINPTLAGYFSKVMQIIIEKRKLDLLEYIFKYKEHAANLIKHSYNKSISDVLNKILSNEDKFITGTTGEEFSTEKQELLKAMIKNMEPTNTGDDIINNCSILCTLIDSKQYLDYLLSEEVIGSIFKLSISGNPMSLRAGLTLIIVAIRTKLNADNTTATNTFGFSTASGTLLSLPIDSKKEVNVDLSFIISQSVENMEKFKEYLMDRSNVRFLVILGG